MTEIIVPVCLTRSIHKLNIDHPSWRPDTGFLLKKQSVNSQPLLVWSFVSELPGFGFHEAIFTLFVFTRTKGSLLNLRSSPSPLQMYKIYNFYTVSFTLCILYTCKGEGFPLKLSRDPFVLVKTKSVKMASWKPKPGSSETKDQTKRGWLFTDGFFEKEPRSIHVSSIRLPHTTTSFKIHARLSLTHHLPINAMQSETLSVSYNNQCSRYRSIYTSKGLRKSIYGPQSAVIRHWRPLCKMQIWT
jgi:hypothetical protein